MRVKMVVLAILIPLVSNKALAWDPVGDMTHPERIIRNIGNEVGNAGREVDRMRTEAQVQTAAPAFEAWLTQSRNTAKSGGTFPIPPNIRQQLQGFYDNDLLNRVSYKVGDGGVFNLANLSIQYGDAGAVTLIDVVVFADHADAQNNTIRWAHELKHVQQFRDWGVRDFAIRYLRSWNSVEGEAYATEDQFKQWRAQVHAQPPQAQPTQFPTPPGMVTPQLIASICATPYGSCGMSVAINIGASCYCPSMYGPVWGIGR